MQSFAQDTHLALFIPQYRASSHIWLGIAAYSVNSSTTSSASSNLHPSSAQQALLQHAAETARSVRTALLTAADRMAAADATDGLANAVAALSISDNRNNNTKKVPLAVTTKEQQPFATAATTMTGGRRPPAAPRKKAVAPVATTTRSTTTRRAAALGSTTTATRTTSRAPKGEH